MRGVRAALIVETRVERFGDEARGRKKVASGARGVVEFPGFRRLSRVAEVARSASSRWYIAA
jgi:hypothetical protein